MEQRINRYTMFLLLCVVIASTLEPVTTASPTEDGSGSGEIVLPYSSLDSHSFITTATGQGPSTGIVLFLTSPLSNITEKTNSLPSILSTPMSQITATTMSLSITASSPAISGLLSMFSPSSTQSSVFPSSIPIPMPTASFISPAATITSSVTQSLLLSPIEVPSVTLPSELPPTSITTNLTAIPMVLDNSTDPAVPLPVLIAVPVGAVVIISVLFILTVICCMRYRRRRKYSISAANKNRLSDYAPRSETPVVPDMDLNTESKKRELHLEDKVADTVKIGIEFPETPRYGSNEDIPALIILNPVKPNIKPMSNSLWSQTLPTKKKIRKDTCSESDVPDRPDSGLMKPAKSTSAIDTLALSTEIANKSTDGTSMTLLLPEATRKGSARNNARNDYDHLLSEEDFIQEALEMNGEPTSLENTGYVFLEPANSSSEKNQTESSAPDHDVDLKAKKDLQPRTMPLSSQPPQHMLPTESFMATAESESIYDTPRSSGIDVMSPKESKQSTSSGSCSSCVEYPSHYDVPKSALLAYRQEAARQQGFSVQPNLVGAQEASLRVLNSPQECPYNSLGGGSLQQPHSPPYYDIPKLLLQTKNKGQKLDNSEGDLVQETNMDDLGSSDEHLYCVPPDVTVNTLKTHKSHQVEASKTDNTDRETVNTSASKPVPKKRKKNEKNDNNTRNSVVPAPRQAKKATKNAALSSVTSSQEELLDRPEPKSTTIANVVPAPRPIKKAISNSSDSVFSSQEKLLDKPETKGYVSANMVPAPRPVKKVVSNSSDSVISSHEKLLDTPETKRDVKSSVNMVPVPRPVKKTVSSSLSSFTGSQEKLLDKSEMTGDVSANVVPAPRPVKKTVSSSSNSVTDSQEKLLDKPESTGDSNPNLVPAPTKNGIHTDTVPSTRPVKLPILNDFQATSSVKQLLSELKSKSNANASTVPPTKPVVKTPTKPSPVGSVPSSVEKVQGLESDINVSTSPAATTSRQLPKKLAKTSPSSITSTTEKLLNEPEPRNSTTVNASVHTPAISAKPVKKPIKNSPCSVTSSMEKLLKEPELKGTNTSPAPSSKWVKKHVRGKSSSDAATPGPVVAREPEAKGDTAKVVPAPKPVVAKKPGLLARSASIEELLSQSRSDVVRPASPKPAVVKKPAILAKMSSSSTTDSLDELLNQPELKNNRATPIRPSVAKKPKPSNPQLIKKSSISSSAEDLLSKPEPKKVADVQSIAINGDGPDSDVVSDSPLVDRLDLMAAGERVTKQGDKLNSKSKPKPKIIPRSQSRHAIVQEQSETTTNSNLPSSPTVAPVRAPAIPTRPTQRPPPIPQRPELKPAPVNA